MAVSQNELYIASKTGTSYRLTQFTGATFSPSGRNEVSLSIKGDNIPIWSLMRNFMRREHVENVDYRRVGSNHWISGEVIAIGEEDSDVTALGFIVEYRDTPEYPSVAIRGSLANGRVPDSTSISCFWIGLHKRDGWNYENFIIDEGDGAYTDWKAEAVNPQYGYSLLNMYDNFNTVDGSGSLYIYWPTCLYPCVLNPDSEIPQYGFEACCEQMLDSAGHSIMVSFSDMKQGDVGTENTYRISTGTGMWGSQSMLVLKSGYNFDDNPYKPTPNNGGGGGGSYNGDSDTILPDGVPNVSALSTGFVNAWDLSVTQCQDLHAYMISDGIADIYERLKVNPMDFIISLQAVPYAPLISEQAEITVAGSETGVTAGRVGSQYLNLSCGSISLSEFWGSYRDYAPFTSISIYLPFCSIHELDINEAMASTIAVDYRIDILSGECVATVTISNERGLQGAVYHFSGNCNLSVPVTGQDHSASLGKWLGVMGHIAGAGINAIAGNANGVISEGLNAGMSIMQPAKVKAERAGSLSGNAGVMGNYTPFIIVKRPSPSIAADFNHYKGWVSNVTRKLGSLSGYTEVAYLKEDNIPCTKEELEIIRQLLKDGVYL